MESGAQSSETSRATRLAAGARRTRSTRRTNRTRRASPPARCRATRAALAACLWQYAVQIASTWKHILFHSEPIQDSVRCKFANSRRDGEHRTRRAKSLVQGRSQKGLGRGQCPYHEFLLPPHANLLRFCSRFVKVLFEIC